MPFGTFQREHLSLYLSFRAFPFPSYIKTYYNFRCDCFTCVFILSSRHKLFYTSSTQLISLIHIRKSCRDRRDMTKQKFLSFALDIKEANITSVQPTIIITMYYWHQYRHTVIEGVVFLFLFLGEVISIAFGQTIINNYLFIF